MKKIRKTSTTRIVIGRIVSIIPVIFLQGFIIFVLAKWLAPFATFFYTILSVLSTLFTLYLIAKKDEGAYKMLWLLVIFLAPLPGAFMYLFYGNKRTGKQLEQRIKDVNITIPVQLNDDTELMKALETENKICQTHDRFSCTKK